jgi:hypothetical protein
MACALSSLVQRESVGSYSNPKKGKEQKERK